MSWDDVSKELGLEPQEATEAAMQPTSLDAARTLDHAGLRAKILLELEVGNFTDEELEQRLDMKHQSVSAARNRCMHLGLLAPSGGKRLTTSGRFANVWQLTTAGNAEVSKLR